MSIFGNRSDTAGTGPSQIILAVDDIDQAVQDLQARGIGVSGPPITAGTFLKFVTVHDPKGNVVAVSEYLRNPVVPV